MRENFATVLETVADVRADRTVVTHGNRGLTWRQLDERAARLAAFLAGRGVGAEARVAIINTGGEKVFAEEVEQVLIEHPGVRDALVVGLPDLRWGQRVTAVVAPASGVVPTVEALVAHVAGRLADYKKPRGIVFVPEVRRSPSGKADLRWALAAASGQDQAGQRASP